MTSASSTAASFRAKAAFMKTWRPEHAPSNRDRLELFALHRQAVSGDAPSNPPPNDASVGEKSKYTAWKSKRGLSQDEAMTQYISESDRQVRVYGTVTTNTASADGSAPQTPTNTPRTTNTPNSVLATPRGLAAIPLLCAAAAESRVAYLRRMEVTTPETSWWSRQEPLSAPSFNHTAAIPERILLRIASLLEQFSLNHHAVPLLPISVLQSLLWPLHNMLLSAWMGLILVMLLWQSAWHVTSTLVWGARRTGRTLTSVWDVELLPTSRAVDSLCETHQSLSVRLMGLVLWPLSSVVVQGSVLVLPEGSVGSSVILLLLMTATWWYWLLVVPWATSMLIGAAAMSGTCFAVIEFAGV